MQSAKSLNLAQRDLFLCLLIFGLTLAAQSLMALRWDALGVFAQYNVIFDTDPNEWHSNFANGWAISDFRHPLLQYFVSIPMRVFAATIGALNLTDNPAALREFLALFVSPLAAAVKAVCFYLTIRLVGLGIAAAAIGCGYATLSFSSVVFSAVPSSYPVAGMTIGMVTLCSAYLYRRDTALAKALLLTSAFLSVGTTVSNAAQYAWVYCVTLIHKGAGFLRSLIVPGIYALLILGATFALSIAFAQLRGLDQKADNMIVSDEFIELFQIGPREIIERLSLFPETLSRTIIPTSPVWKPNIRALQRADPLKIEATFAENGFGVWSAILYLAGVFGVGGGALLAFRQGGMWRWLATGSCATILTYWAFYSWFGTNHFLFSQHWQFPTSLLLCGWFSTPFLRTRTGLTLAALGLLIFLAGDIYVLDEMTRAIAGSG